MRNEIKLLLPLVMVGLITAAGLSQEMSEIKKKIAAMKKEAAALMENGHVEEAKQLNRKAQELMEQAIQANEKKSPKLTGETAKKKIVGELQEKKIEKPSPSKPKHEHPAVHEIEQAGHRLKHIRVAIENLKAAEMHDLARELSHRAEGMEKEILQAKARLAEMHKDLAASKHPEKESTVDKLREANERLLMENKELRKKLESLNK